MAMVNESLDRFSDKNFRKLKKEAPQTRQENAALLAGNRRSRRIIGFILGGIVNTLGVTFLTLLLERLPFLNSQFALLVSQLVWLALGARLFAATMFGIRRLPFSSYVRYAQSNALTFISIQAFTPIFVGVVGLSLAASILWAALIGATMKFLLLNFFTFGDKNLGPVNRMNTGR